MENYYLYRNKEWQGPYSLGQLRSMWHNGSLTTDTYYRGEDKTEYLQLSAIAHLLDAPSVVTQTTPTLVRAAESRASAAGVLILLVGLAISGYFFFIYDTSVRTESRYISGVGTIGGERVHNQGLMQNRLIGCIAGIAISVVGIGVIVAGSRRQPI